TLKKIIIIAGPTASGKSGVALALAESLNGVIINADSMQVYKDIPILSAAPDKQALLNAPHKLYGIYDASIHGNMVDWLNLAQKEISKARQNNKIPIVVGGTGLYIENLEKGTTPIPETPPEIRRKVADMYNDIGLSGLYLTLQQTDKKTAQRLGPNDTTRIRRALEVWYHTKKTMSYWQKIPLKRLFNSDEFIRIYIKPPREILDQRIYQRFDIMMQQGALEEVQALVNRNLNNRLPAMHALGVQELKSYLKGECALEDAVNLSKLHTRQYAKRQSTWFNNRFQADFTYLNTDEPIKNFVDDIKKAL
ncbi:MAG: tRNA (adenosine(37)-N6)-dimethylallyltransferase MiaA, partial [Alphaproteobacteria bacterium]|nr:tRNA (adenosine(37)-N6)-dimethylallyltransferase MiaA [Alphaproteobacteria bacterium]